MVVVSVGRLPLGTDAGFLSFAAPLIEDAVTVVEGREAAQMTVVVGTKILAVGAEWALVFFRYEQHRHPS